MQSCFDRVSYPNQQLLMQALQYLGQLSSSAIELISPKYPADPVPDLTLGCGFFDSPPSEVGLVPRGNYSINYEIHGLGQEKICLVMGFMASMASWKQIVAAYPKDRYSLLVMDNRGLGFSSNGSIERYSTSAMADDLIALLDHIKWTASRSVNLVGCSMGGMIAMEAAFKIPSRLKSLLLLATCASHVNPPRSYYEHSVYWFNFLRPKPDPIVRVDALCNDLYSQLWLDSHDDRYPSFPTNRDRMHATFLRRWKESPPVKLATVFGQGGACATHFVSRERLEFIGENIPDSLCLTGTEDSLIYHACSDTLAAGLNCPVVKLEGRGHGLPFESEREVVESINQLIESSTFRYG